MGVLALGVVRLAAVAAAAGLLLGRLGRTEVGDRVGEAVGLLRAGLLVAVRREVGLFSLGHARILSEGNNWLYEHMPPKRTLLPCNNPQNLVLYYYL